MKLTSRNQIVVVVTACIVLIGACIYYLIAQRPSEAKVPVSAPMLVNQPMKGAGVDVMLIEDYHCPTCREFTRTVYPELSDMAEAGEIRLIYLNPAKSGEKLQTAAVGECAWMVRPESFWDVKRAFYSNDLSGDAPARLSGLDGTTLNACWDDAQREAVRDLEIARQLGVNSTPTVVVDNVLYKNPGIGTLKKAVAGQD